MSILWRGLASLVALASLFVTVPASLWLTLILLAAFLPDQMQRTPPDWINLLGWPPMIAVVAVTAWGIYRIWRPYLKDNSH